MLRQMLKVMDRESPCWEPQLFPETPEWIRLRLQGRTAGLPAGDAIGIKHEGPSRRGASVIRHFLHVGDATCARPVRLSEIGIDTPDCTGVVSELQMEATHGGEGNRCRADTHSRWQRAVLLSQDYNNTLIGFWEIYSQFISLHWLKNESKLWQQQKCTCH